INLEKITHIHKHKHNYNQTTNKSKLLFIKKIFNLYIFLIVLRSFRLLGTVSSDSIRCTNFINSNESDLRISSVDNTCTDSLVTALDDEALLICDATNEMARTKVHFDDVSLYGTPKEELLPNIQTISEKMSSNFLKNQLQSWFQPTDNRLAMKLFGSKKALVKERIRQKTAGHWVIHPCSSFR
ncbi:uncharacterized protein LOC116348475, partial [Contarinia nasturtii]|uniref:uncharacterized protein LOC116348475 n=1 Tax=Contarinia nasturtii TaxID=265458 RepID=UPI0012D3FFA1